MNIALIILSGISVILALTMLFSKNAITAALSLLGVLLMTAGIYGLIGEHLIATIQLVVYAGAIMVLFVFSIMLLNLNHDETEYKKRPVFLTGMLALGGVVFGAFIFAFKEHFANHAKATMGQFDQATIKMLGGNSKVLAHSLFTKFYVSFEVISLALLVAVVGAVVLAKRKVD